MELTRQLEKYVRVLGIHAAAIGHASINGEFEPGDLKNLNNEGTYHNLPPDMRVSIVFLPNLMIPKRQHQTTSSVQKTNYSEYKQLTRNTKL